MNIYDAYYSTLRIRRIEETIAARYSEQKMRCPTHLSIGQELIPVVISHFLSAADKVFSTHRAHAHYLAKGGDLNALIAELYGKKTGCTGGRGGSMHLSDLTAGFVASTAIVANSIPLAVGYALHQKLSGLPEITVCFFGEGATEEGAFYESLNFAVLKKLPVLFVCENNRYSVYSNLSVRQPESRNINQLASAIGTVSFHTNGNKFASLLQTCEQAIDTVRLGQGPVFIELDTYRHREHCGPNYDDNLKYRPEEEVSHWIKLDPLTLMEADLNKYPDFAERKQEMLLKIEEEIANAFEFAEQSDFSSEENFGTHLYA